MNKPSKIDDAILPIVEGHPGIALGDLCRAVIESWHPASVRSRVSILAGRGQLRTEKINGRLNVYPTDEAD